jgi:hypothetical protein
MQDVSGFHGSRMEPGLEPSPVSQNPAMAALTRT